MELENEGSFLNLLITFLIEGQKRRFSRLKCPHLEQAA